MIALQCTTCATCPRGVCDTSVNVYTDHAGSESRQTPTGLAVPLVPLDRQASHDCQKWLAFTPPASLSSPHSSRRVSQGLPGGAGRLLNQADDSALRLPPLTPPGAEASTCGSLPQPPPMPPASGSASPNLWRSANAPALRPGSYPAGSLPPGTAAAEVDTLTAKLHSQQSLVQQGMASHSAQPVLHAAGSAAIGEQLLPSNHKVSSGHEQVEAKLVAVQLHDHEQQNPAGRPQGTSTSMQQQRRHASSAGGDMGQLGPPITRMRPAPLPAFSNSAGKKSTSKPQAAADSSSSFAEAFLCDAVLCGWEQHTNEGVSVMCDFVTLSPSVLHQAVP